MIFESTIQKNPTQHLWFIKIQMVHKNSDGSKKIGSPNFLAKAKFFSRAQKILTIDKIYDHHFMIFNKIINRHFEIYDRS